MTAMKLTKNFSKHEFDSKDGNEMPLKVLDEIKELAKNLQIIRDYFKSKITINSGYRSPQHNKSVGGATNSQHIKGKAADIVVHGKTPKEVFEAIEKLQADGIIKKGGLHAYSSFVHYDHRGINARW